MLKSTHRSAGISTPTATSLPPGWTEHKAPTGHTYYYNADTKQSTYTRPLDQPVEEELQIDYGATQGDPVVQATINALEEFRKHNDPSHSAPGHFTGGRSYQDRPRHGRQGDRPKSKTPIPNCTPWLLVKTKLGRRFVHNTDTNESFWKFPSDVMMAVIEMDRMEGEKKKNQSEEHKVQEAQQHGKPQANPKDGPEAEAEGDARSLPEDAYDSDSYEEVEVTDDEGEEDPYSKRLRLDENELLAEAAQTATGPQEFDEEDIAWQLAAMDADEDDPGYDYPDEYLEEDEEGGVGLTEDDNHALFRSLLDDHQISPFSTFDALIDTNTAAANALISDHRWLALPNMSSRRSAFDAWSRDRVAERNANADNGDQSHENGTEGGKSRKADPKVEYLRFLAENATSKLYWPEFKRKWRKAPEMANRYFADKDREKLYREYVSKITKTSETDRKKELIALLKSTSPSEWSAGTMPLSAEKDLRFYGIRDEKARRDLVEGYMSTISRA